MRSVEEITRIVDECFTRQLRFVDILNLSKDEAIKAVAALDDSTYKALRSSVLRNKAVQKNTQLRVVKHEATNPNPASQRDIFSEDFNGELSEKEMQIRTEYLKEFLALKHSPDGCSGCQIGALKRKYIAKLTA